MALLLTLAVILVIGAATLFLSAWNNGPGKATLEDKRLAALARGKEAVLGWVAQAAVLPCPAGDGDDGMVRPPCNGAPVNGVNLANGNLPWQTLGLERTSTGETLRYVLPSAFAQQSPAAPQICLDKAANPPRLLIGGQPLDPQSKIALVIAPGRACAGPLCTTAYDLYDPDTGFYTTLQIGSTDRVLPITVADLGPVLKTPCPPPSNPAQTPSATGPAVATTAGDGRRSIQ